MFEISRFLENLSIFIDDLSKIFHVLQQASLESFKTSKNSNSKNVLL